MSNNITAIADDDTLYSTLSDDVNPSDIERVNNTIKNNENSYTFDLDKALDTYDPTFPRYTPSKNALEYFNIMRLVQGKDFEFNTPKAHYFMADLLLNEITDPMVFPYSEEVCKTISIDTLRLAFMESRGMSKSTVVVSFFGVYSAIKGELPNGIGKVYFYLVVAAASKGGARVNALAVRAMCEDSPFIKEYFEEVRFTESESEFVRRGSSPKKDRSFLLRYQGISTGIRGVRYGERRPCAIIFDDIILNEAAAYSVTVSKALKTAVASDAVSALKGGGKGRIINCFTPFHYEDVNTSLIMTGAYTPCVIPIAKTFDIPKTVFAARKNLLSSNIESSWESMHPSNSIRAMVISAMQAKELRSFLQERMLRLSSDSDRLVSDSSIQYFDLNDVLRKKENYHIYITTDFTTTSGTASDFSGTASWAVGSDDKWYLLNVILSKRDMKTQYEDTLNEAIRWSSYGSHTEIGIEVDGNQRAHLYSMRKLMEERNTVFPLSRDKYTKHPEGGVLSRGSGVGKHERFRIAVHQLFNTRRIFFARQLIDTQDFTEFLAQIRGATHATFTRSDDAPDLITMLTVIDYILPDKKGNVLSDMSYTGSSYMYEKDDEEDVLNSNNPYGMYGDTDNINEATNFDDDFSNNYWF